MAHAEKPHLPFRWSFIPSQNARDGSIRWTWRAYSQTGSLAMESERTFDSFTECMEHAKTRGYGGR
jgi:hypothetical protein